LRSASAPANSKHFLRLISLFFAADTKAGTAMSFPV
jgi:hypothetical protein